MHSHGERAKKRKSTRASARAPEKKARALTVKDESKAWMWFRAR